MCVFRIVDTNETGHWLLCRGAYQSDSLRTTFVLSSFEDEMKGVMLKRLLCGLLIIYIAHKLFVLKAGAVQKYV